MGSQRVRFHEGGSPGVCSAGGERGQARDLVGPPPGAEEGRFGVMVAEEGGGDGGRRPLCERRGVHGHFNVYAVRGGSRWREGGDVPVMPPESCVSSKRVRRRPGWDRWLGCVAQNVAGAGEVVVDVGEVDRDGVVEEGGGSCPGFRV